MEASFTNRKRLIMDNSSLGNGRSDLLNTVQLLRVTQLLGILPINLWSPTLNTIRAVAHQLLEFVLYRSLVRTFAVHVSAHQADTVHARYGSTRTHGLRILAQDRQDVELHKSCILLIWLVRNLRHELGCRKEFVICGPAVMQDTQAKMPNASPIMSWLRPSEGISVPI